MWPLRTLKDSRGESEGRRLVLECESFLSGRYAFDLQAGRLPVPAWAWLNTLVHGSAEQLLEQAGGAHIPNRRGDRLAGQWHGAVALVAWELFTMAGSIGCDVDDLQHAIFLDLEAAPERPAIDAWTTQPSHFVELVRGSLARFRDSAQS